MSAFAEFLSQPVVARLGWALVHFLWQGAALAALLAVALPVLRKRSPNARYLVACGALVLMMVAPVGTLAWLSRPIPVAAPTTPLPDLPEFSTSAQAPMIVGPITAVEPPPAAVRTVEPAAPAPPTPWKNHALLFIERHLPWFVVLWLAGVVILSIRLLVDFIHVQRIRRRGSKPVPLTLAETARRLAVKLGLRQAVHIFESALAQAPVAIGWLRPVILLPASLLTRLTPAQLEAILAHELAHIRRHDYLVNLFQTVAETLLFYHPAVHWVSLRIRHERELCCDDLAVSLCCDTVTYACALAELAEFSPSRPALAASGTGGHLLARIRRLLGVKDEHERLAARWLAGAVPVAILMAILSLVISCSLRPAPAENAQDNAGMTKQCERNLGEIVKGIITYRGMNNDKVPPSLVDLFPKYLPDPKVLVCTADKAPMKIKYGLPCSYRYIGNVPWRDIKAVLFIAYDHTQHDGGRNVAFFDGHIHHVSEQDFQKALAELYEQLKPLLRKPDFPGDRERVKAFCEDKDFSEESWPPAAAAQPEATESGIKLPAGMVGTWLFENSMGDDEQMAIFPGGRRATVVTLYSNGHRDEVPYQVGRTLLRPEFGGTKSSLLLLDNGSLLEGDAKVWKKVASAPVDKLMVHLSGPNKGALIESQSLLSPPVPSPAQSPKELGAAAPADYSEMFKLCADKDLRMPTPQEIAKLGDLWPKVPPEENAAYYLAQAASQIPQDPAKIPAGSSLGDGRNYDGNEKAFADWITTNANALALLRHALDISACQFPPFFDARTNEPADLYTLSVLASPGQRHFFDPAIALDRLSSDEGFLYELKDAPDAAADSYLRCMRIGGKMRQGSGLMTPELMGLAITSTTARKLDALIAHSQLKEETLRRIVAACRELQTPAGRPSEVCAMQAVWLSFALSYAKGNFVNEVNAAALPCFRVAAKDFQGKALPALLGPGALEPLAAFDIRKTGISRYLLEVGWKEVQLCATKIRAAIALYQQKHGGALPDSLDALVPAILPGVPQEPFSGNPMRYGKTPYGWKVWSAGADNVDHGGTSAASMESLRKESDIWQGPDYVFVSNVLSNLELRSRNPEGAKPTAPTEKPKEPASVQGSGTAPAPAERPDEGGR